MVASFRAVSVVWFLPLLASEDLRRLSEAQTSESHGLYYIFCQQLWYVLRCLFRDLCELKPLSHPKDEALEQYRLFPDLVKVSFS